MLPLLFIPILMVISVSGRPLWVRNVSSRRNFVRTLRPAARASSAVIISKFRVSVRPEAAATNG